MNSGGGMLAAVWVLRVQYSSWDWLVDCGLGSQGAVLQLGLVSGSQFGFLGCSASAGKVLSYKQGTHSKRAV